MCIIIMYPYTPMYVRTYMHARFPFNVYRVKGCYWPAKLIRETLTESAHTVLNSTHTAVLCIGMHGGYRQAVARSALRWSTTSTHYPSAIWWCRCWVTKQSCTHGTNHSIHSICQQITRCRWGELWAGLACNDVSSSRACSLHHCEAISCHGNNTKVPRVVKGKLPEP